MLDLQPTKRLEKAPLIRVLCQIRWAGLTKFDLNQVADNMSDSIAGEYPFHNSRDQFEVAITPNGAVQRPVGRLHRFESADRVWAVTLAEQFIALETSDYKTHTEFIERLTLPIHALLDASNIPSFSWIGYRYTNRLDDNNDISNLNKLFVPEILGGLATPVSAQVSTGNVKRMACETSYFIDECELVVRSVLLEPEYLFDPEFPAINKRSFVIDIDSHTERMRGISRNEIPAIAEKLSNLGSAHFYGLLTKDGQDTFQ